MEEKKEIKETAKSGASAVDKFSGYIAAFLLGAGVAGGLCWYMMGYSQRDVNEVGKDFVITKECREFLEKNGGITDGKPVEDAVKAYVKSIAKDDYTYYYMDDSVKDMLKYVNGSGTAEQSGFSIAVAEDGNILLEEVVEGLPAFKQGLRTGDEITAIDGDSVSEAGFENIANKMLGKDGTKVRFTVLRNGGEFDVDFVRSSVVTSNVDYEDMGDIGYIRLKGFEQMAKGQLEAALEKAENKKKLVIDIRENTGGDTESGVYMAAEVCGNAKCVLTKYDGTEEVIEQSFDLVNRERDIVVLVNDRTASAAEIFAASLKSNANAKLVGTKTYGKGVFQLETTLSNGGVLHYTAGTFCVDGWDNWDGVGLEPDVEVLMDKELIGTDSDIQLKRAIALLD